MQKFKTIVLIALGLCPASISLAASPEQAGTYTGSLKTKVYYTTGPVTVKSTMSLSLDVDNFTTVTIDGIEQPSAAPGSQNSFYSSTDGFALWQEAAFPGASLAAGAVHFKKTTMIGTFSSFVFSSGGPPVVLISNSSGKFKLKKTAP
jgi:hypothetical protein